MTTATPAKLRSGAWGARVKSEAVKAGDLVTITTRSGKSWKARITQVVWSGNGASICATESMDRPSRPARSQTRGRRTGCSCGSREDGDGILIGSARNCSSCEMDA